MCRRKGWCLEACGLGVYPDGELGYCYVITHVVFDRAVISVTRVLKLDVIQELMSHVWAAQETSRTYGKQRLLLAFW